jgi:hypothetical protein
MEYDGTNEYKCKFTLGFGITTSKQRGPAMEMLLMTMMMKVDMEAFKILVPSPIVWW